MPAQRPRRSRQDYPTPWEFVASVEARFGPLAVDLAASEKNRKAPHYIGRSENSLTVPWYKLPFGNWWLNPPFDAMELWASKCADNFQYARRILLLTPAGVSTDWFADSVHGKARVLFVRPRLVFEGQTDPFPKDLMLSVFGEDPGYETWRWK